MNDNFQLILEMYILNYLIFIFGFENATRKVNIIKDFHI